MSEQNTALQIYEHPLNERIRGILRLETLFKSALLGLSQTSPWHSQQTLCRLVDIGDIVSRNEIRLEVIKELERLGSTLTALQASPAVDGTRLGIILDNLDILVDELHDQGPVGKKLLDIPLLADVKRRYQVPGGLCQFDLPELHYWLCQPAEIRLRDLTSWFNHLQGIHQAVQLILKLIRESGRTTNELAADGHFQVELPASAPLQLLKISLDGGTPCYPEISAGKHMASIRFTTPATAGEPQETATADRRAVHFQLKVCAL
ncbi:MAG: cell division protein ZapD [Gammaproteobacteria bacterium]|nr:cell division protein ZapD [Gammaproteobacteria bacterium]